MKTLKHIELKTPEGKTQIDQATQKELSTSNLITICLGQTAYKTAEEQWKAYEVSKKIEGGNLELEDAEYELVKKCVLDFKPYFNGFTFIPFTELFK